MLAKYRKVTLAEAKEMLPPVDTYVHPVPVPASLLSDNIYAGIGRKTKAGRPRDPGPSKGKSKRAAYMREYMREKRK